MKTENIERCIKHVEDLLLGSRNEVYSADIREARSELAALKSRLAKCEAALWEIAALPINPAPQDSPDAVAAQSGHRAVIIANHTIADLSNEQDLSPNGDEGETIGEELPGKDWTASNDRHTGSASGGVMKARILWWTALGVLGWSRIIATETNSGAPWLSYLVGSMAVLTGAGVAVSGD